MFVGEIGEQPAALRDLIHAYRGEAGAAALDRLAELFRGGVKSGVAPGPVLFTGMGSSLYAAEAVLARLAAGGVEAAIREAGEWLHYGRDAMPAGGLAVAVSQSGESVETRALAERLSGRVPVVAVTND